MTILRCWNCSTPVENAADEFCKPCRERLSGPAQPADGYTKNVTPRGLIARPEDAFPEACCEGASDE